MKNSPDIKKVLHSSMVKHAHHYVMNSTLTIITIVGSQLGTQYHAVLLCICCISLIF